MSNRPEMPSEDIEDAIKTIQAKLLERLEEKGKGIYVSSHEMLGIITEEYDELIEAVRNNSGGSIYAELLDIVVGCIFGMVSITSGETDWL